MSGAGQLVARGKVRDVYDAGEDALLLVATDRISAFDVVLPEPDPRQGPGAHRLSLHWFERTADLVGNHLLSERSCGVPGAVRRRAEPGGQGAARAPRRRRAARVRRARLPERQRMGAVPRDAARCAASSCPPGLVESDRLPEPIFTPTTKAAEGHDLPLTPDEAIDLVGRGLYERLKELTLAHLRAHRHGGRSSGASIVADTKFEFGFAGGELHPRRRGRHARFEPVLAGRRVRAGSRAAELRQAVRARLARRERVGPRAAAPALACRRLAGTAARYREAYERMTGEPFHDYLERRGAATVPRDDAAALDPLRREHA